MSKELRAFRAGSDRRIIAPWVRQQDWIEADKVYRKESGVWVEWWPLRPLAPTGVTGAFIYRNDQIELDVDWVAPVGGPAVENYNVTIAISNGSSVAETRTATDWTPAMAWQGMAGLYATITVVAVSPTGMVGASASSVRIVIPQLPPPPAPTGVDVVIVNRAATLSWVHGGGNRLSSFETRTTYQGVTTPRTAGKDVRSQNVTAWSTEAVPGDPGGSVSVLVRAIGPGGTSAWASDTGTVPNVPNPPPPPPVVVIPGTVHMSQVRFYNGDLIADYSCPNAVTVRVWWARLGSGLVHAGDFGPSGRVTIPGSQAWARDEVSQYQVHMEGISSTGHSGVLSVSAWCRKLPNPYYVRPTDHLAWRGNAEYNDGQLRQGQSYNEWSPFSPTIFWQSYAFYGDGMKQAFNPARIGYALTVTRGQVFMWRTPTGGSGGATAPHIGYHTATTKQPGPILGAALGVPMARDELAWQDLQLGYARQLTQQGEPAVRGIGIYHPNQVLNLGQVSAEYAKFYGPSATFWTVPMWTCQFYHDG